VIDITRYFVCFDPEQTMSILANYVLINEYKDKDLKLGTCCSLIDEKVTFILKVLSGSDDNYSKVQIFDKSVSKHFDFQEKKCLDMDTLLNIFYRKAQTIIINTVNENKKRNNISFVRMMGSFCNNGKFVSECNIQIKDLFETDNIENVIHMICHIGYVTQEFQDMLYDSTQNIKISTALDGIFSNMQDSVYNFKQVRVTQDHLKVYENIHTNNHHDKTDIISKIKYGKITNVNTHNLALRELLRKIEEAYEVCPNESQLITQQIIITLLENITVTTQFNIPNIMENLIEKQFLNKELVLNVEYYIMNVIKSGDLDCSPQLCLKTWNLILENL
jgi:hypothetical protein